MVGRCRCMGRDKVKVRVKECIRMRIQDEIREMSARWKGQEAMCLDIPIHHRAYMVQVERGMGIRRVGRRIG